VAWLAGRDLGVSWGAEAGLVLWAIAATASRATAEKTIIRFIGCLRRHKLAAEQAKSVILL